MAGVLPEVVLEVRDLVTEFSTPDGVGKAVNGVSFDVCRGETLGIVGESGCGKSVTALSILRLVPSPPGRVVSGSVRLGDRDLLQASERVMRDIRGNEIAMIFQEPMTSLNPVLTIGYQIAEALRRHQGLTRKAAAARAVEMLDVVRIPEPARRAREYPHQLSGGMRQRAMIAMALSCSPNVLIADEPTTALDVTIQAQVLDLIRNLQTRLGTAVILITHDLGVIAQTAHRVIVMYAGRKVEEAGVKDLFARPRHPYTRGLLASVPRLGTTDERDAKSGQRLTEIPGIVPTLTRLPSGCAFAPRCPSADDQCTAAVPPYEEKRSGHWAACWHADREPGQPS
ncbi:MAG: ABC transporter ATP-binding protein [Gammaproteobacteria bacterium]|nr:ABC transporter ATP-binding protein [Gammaproteobacteria bacterium]